MPCKILPSVPAPRVCEASLNHASRGQCMASVTSRGWLWRPRTGNGSQREITGQQSLRIVEGWNPKWGLQVGPQKQNPKRDPEMGSKNGTKNGTQTWNQKWDPKAGPKIGPKNGSQKWNLQMGFIRFAYKSFKRLEMGPKNGSQKWVPKMGPKNGSQKWVPKMGPKMRPVNASESGTPILEN